MKFLFFIGTRPEAIKIAPLYLAFKKSFPEYDVRLCLTGQHNEMLWQVMDVFELKADYKLEVMTQGQTLYSLSARLLSGVQDVVIDFNPDYVFVHGDTTTSFVAALGSYYNQSKICHIEAGLRTYNLYSPFPEEANRQLTSRIADLHFAPSNLSKKNLLKEGISEKKIVITGNTVVDALLYVSEKLRLTPEDRYLKKYSAIDFSKKIVLVTNHRRENLENGIKRVCEAIRDLSIKYPEVCFVFPVHLNPIIKEIADEVLLDLSNVHLLAPLEYDEFIFFMNKSYMIITDSGGIQEEAPILGKPVVVTRETTERPEAVEAGCCFLLGPNTKKIIDTVSKLIENNEFYKSIAKPNYVYGDGKASQRIVEYFKDNILR